MPTIRDIPTDYIPVQCPGCGRRTSVPLVKLTPNLAKALDRLKCKRCGRRGRPRIMRGTVIGAG